MREGEDAGDVQDEDGLEVEAGEELGEVALFQSCQSFQAGLSMVYSPDALLALAQWGLRWDPMSVMTHGQRLQEAAGCINDHSCVDSFAMEASYVY